MNQSNEHYFTRTCTIHVVSQVNGTRRPKYNYWELPWGIDSSSETLQPCVFDSPSDTLNARISFFPFTFLALATVNHNKISTVIIQTRTKHDRNCISNTCGLPAYWVLPFSIAESLGRILRLSTFLFFCFICLSIAVLNKELYITVYPPIFLLTALKTLTNSDTSDTWKWCLSSRAFQEPADLFTGATLLWTPRTIFPFDRSFVNMCFLFSQIKWFSGPQEFLLLRWDLFLQK